MPSLTDAIASQLAFAHDTLLLACEVPAGKETFQTSPLDNHALWTLGHCTASYSSFVGMLSDTKISIPENYNAIFGFSSKPDPDASKYPPIASVRAELQRAYEAFAAVVKSLPDSAWAGPSFSDPFHICPTMLSAVTVQIHHLGWHTGQVSTIRRALGLKSIFG
jgi:hypothetical protein